MNVARTAICLAIALASASVSTQAQAPQHPAELVSLAKSFRDWRSQSSRETADYGARVAAQRKGVADFRQKLEALNIDAWSTHAKVDMLVLRAEIDDLGFDLDVIRQVSRNPDFYITEAASDVTRHLGGRYQSGPGVPVPYDAARATAIVDALNATPAIVAQAPKLLTEPVGEMADMALERLENIQASYAELAKVLSPHVPDASRAPLTAAATKAGAAMADYGKWIKANRAKMTAPAAIGRKPFEWYVRNVMFMPYNSEQLLMQAEMERLRGWSFLMMEQQKNRHLPKLEAAKTNHEYSEWKDATDVQSRLWADEQQLFTRPDLGPMRDRDGGIWIEPFGMLGFPAAPIAKGEKVEFLVPPDHWFSKIYWEIGHRLDPGTNHAHSDYPGHTFEGAVSSKTTCDLRRGNRTRGDAWTYYMEDVQLQMDYPFVRGPRVREWMWSLLIMRAERVYAAVKFASGELSAKQVEEHFMKTVPGMEPHVARKHEVWRKFVDPAQVMTYQVGRMQVYQLMKDRALQLGDKFDLKAFNDALLATGQIPVSLARWELTGLDDEIKPLLKRDLLPSGSGTQD